MKISLDISLTSAALRQGGGVVPWTPIDLGSSLYDMWDAELAGTLTLSGAVVDAWNSVKNGYLTNQTLSASKPVYSATGFNGRPGIVFDGQDDYLNFEGVGVLPTGAAPCEIWALMDQPLPSSTVTTGLIICYGGTAGSSRRRLTRGVPSGDVNRVQVGVGDGTTEVTRSNLNVEFSGRHVVRGIVSGTTAKVVVDGVDDVTANVVPATGTTRTRIGTNTAASPAGFVQGTISLIAVTTLLSTDQAAQMLAYLKSRGGIA